MGLCSVLPAIPVSQRQGSYVHQHNITKIILNSFSMRIRIILATTQSLNIKIIQAFLALPRTESVHTNIAILKYYQEKMSK